MHTASSSLTVATTSCLPAPASAAISTVTLRSGVFDASVIRQSVRPVPISVVLLLAVRLSIAWGEFATGFSREPVARKAAGGA